VLPPVTDLFEALKPESPQLTEKGNVLSVTEVRVGNAEEALKGAAFVTRKRYTTQRIEHAFLEPEAALAVPWSKDGEPGVKIFDGGQGGYEDRRQIAELLDLPERLVNVVLVQNGGGFGGKEDLMGQHHAAMLCLATGRPVMLRFDRKMSLRMHAKRHPIVMDYELGCDRDGRLVALVARMHSDSGAYASVGMKVIERAVAHSAGAYAIPNVHVPPAVPCAASAPIRPASGSSPAWTSFAPWAALTAGSSAGTTPWWKARPPQPARC